MGVSVFPAAGGGASEALPLGATAKVASAYAQSGGWKYNTSTPAGTYQLTVQAPEDQIYGIRTANNVQVGNINGNKTVPFKTSSTEASMTIGSIYPFRKVEFTASAGTTRTVNGGNGLFILTTQTGYLYTSTDGLTWTNRTTGTEGSNPSCNVPGYVNDRWVVPGWTNAGTAASILHSTDGVTWSHLNLSSVQNGRIAFVGYGNGQYYSLSEAGSTTTSVARSSNFSSWSSITMPTTNNPQCYIYYNHKGTNYHIIGCTGGVLFYSTTGNSGSWSTANNANAGDIRKFISAKSGELITLNALGSSSSSNGALGFLGANATDDLPTTWFQVEMNSTLTVPATPIQGNYLFGMYIMIFASTISMSTTAQNSNSQVGQYKMLLSRDGITWTIKEAPYTHFNINGQPMQDVNGVLCYAGNVGLNYFTTAFNSAAFHITSTALASA